MEQEIIDELRRIIVSRLGLEEITPEEIDPDEPLFGEGLGLDSIDALDIGVAIKKKWPILFPKDKNETHAIFANLRSLAKYIADNTK